MTPTEWLFCHECERIEHDFNPRRFEFLDIMRKYLYDPSVNWDCFWSWYYHSNIPAIDAFAHSLP